MRPALTFSHPSSLIRLSAALAPNRWDILLLPLVLALFMLFAWGVKQMGAPYTPGAPSAITLDPALLPIYALRTLLRMALAMAASLAFTLVYGTIAAKSERAGRIMIPLLDILQSVPILGFMSLTLVGFLKLFPNVFLGPELAAVFALFTSQAWNMAFSFYASLRAIPQELYQVAALFRLTAWQRLWKLEVPFALPSLIWNAMMSVAGGWFFIVAAEAIQVEGYDIALPGVGSYIALAIRERNLAAIGYAIGAMMAVIVLTDQLVFRPLLAWGERFKSELTAAQERPRSWVLEVLRRARLTALMRRASASLWEASLRMFRRMPQRHVRHRLRRPDRAARLWLARTGNLLLIVVAAASTIALVRFIHSEVSTGEVARVFLYGAITALRVALMIALATLLWVPIGVWIGLRPRLASRAQPLVVFLAAFPANLVFPIVVSAVVARHLDPEIWLSPLMVLGTQWYILFNVIAGAAALPADLREAADNLGLHGWAKWRRVLLPAVFPTYVTGGLTASGGAWNASVVAEVVSWGNTTLQATGLGGYIAMQTVAGDHPRIALGVAVMSLYVIMLNRTVWERLYRLARSRYIEG